MKSWDVFMNTFVNVKLPDHVDPDTPEGHEQLYIAARDLYTSRLIDGDVEFDWARYEDGDSKENDN